MASLPLGNTTNCSLLCERRPVSFMGISALPLTQLRIGAFAGLVRGRAATHSLCRKEMSLFWGKGSDGINKMKSKKVIFTIPRSSSSNSNGGEENSPDNAKKQKSFGYSRKDVILIGVGVTALGVGLKSGLEFVGVDPLQAGNVVQLVLVLGLTIGWISTYIFRVSNKEMTYAQQLRDYESAVMEKRLEGLTEAELEALLEQVDEEKRRLGEKVN
ncbi:PREDICTED: uncharacterized protein LOC101304870 [Fragaria vesca subsp. vesca]|uniref:uncharacterized protein LOC101304870 n=1 Tax=Fragaria vesca subsp. vesca TaxID=101020 RepID=UPI0002C2E729|nr:PREDICTED: uncharacterized protein LOC101304870 [Fragaria vesca subsp. vesca]XP_011464484.1 PREDICTED: uncharacterized protein LOC101304870 [Fragaria vesca subsp. vesca]XP_011464485.1 PREDICTED: uncharacterized protein LOC101304870 [Fragaria vesca subsp. vesca]